MFALEWENKAEGAPKCGVPPPLRVMPVTMTVIFILEERSAAGTEQVEMASRTRNHKLERTQRERLWKYGKDQKPKLPRESSVIKVYGENVKRGPVLQFGCGFQQNEKKGSS